MAADARPLRVLFVCVQNKLRSPTAERVFAHHPALEVASAGTDRSAGQQLSRDVLEWADVVLCMEKSQRDYIRTKFRGAKPDEAVLSLGIPDEYEFMAPDLIELLERLVPPRLQKYQRQLNNVGGP